MTCLANIKDRITIEKKRFAPGNLCFDSAYAAIEAKITCPAVPSTDIKTVLRTYLENGIQEPAIKTSKSMKLSRVGFLTKNRGGQINSSSKGLNAFETA